MAYVSKEQSKQVKQQLSKEFPDFKFSVTVQHYSKLNVVVLAGPLMLTTKSNGYEQINKYSFDRHNANELYTAEVLAFWKRVYEIANAGNYNNSDAMVDYFDVGFYLDLEVGKWDKPFIYTGKREQPAPAAEAAPVEPISPIAAPVIVVDAADMNGENLQSKIDKLENIMANMADTTDYSQPIEDRVIIVEKVAIDKVKKPILEQYLERAVSAHSWTSFTPHRRGRTVINEHSAELENDLAAMPDEFKEAYKQKYIELFLAWLSAKGRCISSMVTGPARFPVRRAEKANNAEHAKYTAFQNWRNWRLKKIQKSIADARPDSIKQDDAFASLQKHILHCAKVINGIDNGTERGCSRPLFVSSMVNRIETIAKAGSVDLTRRCIELLQLLNKGADKPILSQSNKVWGFVELAEKHREQKFDASNAESKEFDFTGGKLLLNYSMQRVQIMHDVKPSSEVITKMKRNGFKWAPSVMAWQRKLTDNGLYAAADIIGIDRQTLKG